MAAQLFNSLGRVGLGLAIGASVVNTALYNGTVSDNKFIFFFVFHSIEINLIFFAVDGGSRAVIFDRFTGIKNHVVGEGTHFLIPWVQRAILYDIRSRPRNVSVITGSKGISIVIALPFKKSI